VPDPADYARTRRAVPDPTESQVRSADLTQGLTRRWSPRGVGDPSLPLVDRVLAVRGLVGEPARAMLHPSLLGLHDPGQLPDVDAATDRILSACRAGEPVVIYGDYDVDGITATAILVRTLRAISPGADVRTYVPHRLDEGYGLNADALSQLAAEGARVVVSVDCGITAIAPAEAALAAGIDLIITDHHNPPESDADLPRAHAVVHPRRPGSAYPFGELCGAGVAYKLAWRLLTKSEGRERVSPVMQRLLLDLLAFAAMGTVADVVPLVDENRVLTKFGLERVPSTPFVGLRALIEASGLAGENIDAERVGFALGPRLNACGRMGHAREAVELLLTDDGNRAAEIARQLCALNDERRGTERRITDEAAELAESRGMTGPDRRAIVLAHPDWHPGVVGIVCSRLVERFGRPTILMQAQDTDDGPSCAGSGRSIDGFNLHGALAACSDHLTTFGGHDMAAGLRLRSGDLEAFTDSFIAHANTKLTPTDLVPKLSYDIDADLGELTGTAVRELAGLAPFGRGNPRVKLRLNGVRLAEPPRVMGRSGDHLSLRVESGRGVDRHSMRIVAFGWGDHATKLATGSTLDLVVTPKLNHWNGRTSVEGELHDLLVHSARPPEVEVRVSRGSVVHATR
jgi:single-stranded-DNA-specific exonuclease